VFAVPEVQLRVEACGEVPKVTLVGLSVHVSPAGVEVDTVKATVPVKPFTAVTVIVEVPVAPAKTWAGVAPAAMVKSTTTNVIVPVVWDSVPSVPVTVTV
jgi:hypothetical protein